MSLCKFPGEVLGPKGIQIQRSKAWWYLNVVFSDLITWFWHSNIRYFRRFLRTFLVDAFVHAGYCILFAYSDWILIPGRRWIAFKNPTLMRRRLKVTTTFEGNKCSSSCPSCLFRTFKIGVRLDHISSVESSLDSICRTLILLGYLGPNETEVLFLCII